MRLMCAYTYPFATLLDVTCCGSVMQTMKSYAYWPRVFGVSDRVRGKTGCPAAETS